LKGLSLPATLAAGQSVAFNVVYAPHRFTTVSATYTFSTSANSTFELTASGTGVAGGGLQVSPASLSFGSVPVGATGVQSQTITNNGNGSVVLSSVSLSSNLPTDPFYVTGLNLPVTLSAGQSLTFGVAFHPTSTGNEAGMIAITTGSGGQLSIAESGVGSAGGTLTVSPATLNFGNVVVGSSTSQSLTLSAANSSVTVSSDSLSSAEYSLSGVTLPVTLNAGQSLPLTVTFQPQTSGSANASLTFSTAVSGGSGVVVGASLSGTGTAPVQHSVGLNWQPSSSQIVGYNVYRGSQSGGPYARLSSADTTTTYADASVQAGSTYYYVVTAVDSSGTESVYSNQTQATVPTP
jgi:hypothetical protein